ncbi:MAG: hypothetical protein AVDCRST_MAG48-1459 [uncultured Friedmanniella sp.]|uniref:Uncharacterized protein n=1 Tax=uncultured Friedmanniella sp. TaxID=335381 RepID=A0A6J4KEK3_9ACTN|nr:MAG: hypothetical protein AVDCRST_MAG48-1459 [uncultured Friedmanniella sp.]
MTFATPPAGVPRDPWPRGAGGVEFGEGRHRLAPVRPGRGGRSDCG